MRNESASTLSPDAAFSVAGEVAASMTSPAITSASFLSDGLKGALFSFTCQNK